jgi:hypothetical protein
MPGGLGLRFAVEAAFIVAVAVLTIVANFSWRAILLTMLLAWALIALVEWATSRRRPEAVEPSPDVLDAALAATPPEPSPPRRPRPRLKLNLRRPAPTAPLQPPRAEEVELPQHVRVLTPTAPEPEPVAATPVLEPEPVAEPARPPLVSVPTPQPPAPEPQPEPPAPEPVPPPEPSVISLASVDTRPREWNLWELERAVRDTAGSDPERDEERNYLLMYLREFATSNGVLPIDFDPLVRETFGDLLVTVQSQ